MSQPRWSDVLDAFEDRLTAQAAALEMDAPDAIAPFVPPADLSPLPAELAERAIELTQRCHEIEEQLARALESVGVALDRLASAPAAAASAEPVYFDSRV